MGLSAKVPSGSSNPAEELRLRVYHAWIDRWLGCPGNDKKLCPALSVDELAVLFKTENLNQLLDPSRLDRAVQSFRYHFNALRNVTSRQGSEWNCSGIFPAEKLEKAVEEIILCNTDIQPAPVTCQGSVATIPPIQAPSRKPDPASDTPMHIYNEYYPTPEKIKLCADAKYFQAIACSAGICDKGIAQAIADSGNDILIGDYCEAADENTMKILQKVGAGALAFVKLCNLAGLVSDWQFNNLTACIIQFRVLGITETTRTSACPRVCMEVG
jgi:hypothetical protein